MIYRKLYCNICKVGIDDTTIHCDDCNVCIEGDLHYIIGYDHHCPWTGKCIGKGNIIYFRIFIWSTGIYLTYLSLATALTLYTSSKFSSVIIDGIN